jgi:hypothetical protein
MPRPNAIADAVRLIQQNARTPRKPRYWRAVERELQIYVAELSMVRLATHWGPFSSTQTVKISEAKEKLTEAKASLQAAKKLRRLLNATGGPVFGQMGVIARPDIAIQRLEEALNTIDEYLALLERWMAAALGATDRSTSGSRATVLERGFGSPSVVFLRRLIPLWLRATDRSTLGDAFVGVAQSLIAAGTGAPCGELRTQIQDAKRRGPMPHLKRSLFNNN